MIFIHTLSTSMSFGMIYGKIWASSILVHPVKLCAMVVWGRSHSGFPDLDSVMPRIYFVELMMLSLVPSPENEA
ncbi:hypothetical protein E4T56_gene10706 [Termitomyces sp. T112]|nr:hypothetical protein E4T56_gene10706 [Termitomyces sp. T112]